MTHELKVAVVEPAGPAGLELTRRLFQHPRLKSPLLLSRTEERANSISHLLPELNLNGEGTVYPFSWSELHRVGVDLVFLVGPPSVSRELAAEAVTHGLLCIDLSAASGLRGCDAQSAVDTAIQNMNSAYGWEEREATNGLEGAAGGI